MTNATDRSHHLVSPSALDVLESFAAADDVRFDRIVAERVLAEAEIAIPGEGCGVSAQRLVEVGESLNLRIRTVECSLPEALQFVSAGIPIARCLHWRSEDGAEHVQWYLLTGVKGRKVRLVLSGEEKGEHWVSTRGLQRRLRGTDAGTKIRWVIGQAAFGAQAPGRDTSELSGQKPLTPFARLIGFLRPEYRDLWVVLVFSILVGVLALATPVAVEALVNTVAFGRYLQPVVILALLLFTFLGFAAAMRALIAYSVEILQRRLFVRVVEDLAYRLPRVQQEQFDEHHGPELVNRFFDVVTIQKTASALLLDGTSIVLQTIIGMSVLAFYHPYLLGFDVVLLALIGFIVFGLGRGALKTAIKESKAKYAIAAWLEELARHTTAFRLHAGQQFALNRADQLTVDWLEYRRQHFRVVIRQIIFALALQAIAATVLLGLGGWLVIQRELTLGQLVAAELIVMMIVGSFAKLGKHMESFYDLLASMDKLGVLFDLGTEGHDKLFLLDQGGPATLKLHEVSYAYGSELAVSKLNLKVSAGAKVAITGSAGSGKSTVVDLVCGLRSPSSGHIELDGVDLRELRPDSLREHLAVARGIEIFHGTIEENVHLNRPNVRSSDVRKALQKVGLFDELLRLPEGLRTKLQTNGAPLTTSQATRLMLARAIAGWPRLLLIDGTLDLLPDLMVKSIISNLVIDEAPWTLLVATGRQIVADACDRTVRMMPATPASNASESALT